jgi:hypothetical protein
MLPSQYCVRSHCKEGKKGKTSKMLSVNSIKTNSDCLIEARRIEPEKRVGFVLFGPGLLTTPNVAFERARIVGLQ